MLSRAGFPGRVGVIGRRGDGVVYLPELAPFAATASTFTATAPAGYAWPTGPQSVTMVVDTVFGDVSIPASLASTGVITPTGMSTALALLFQGESAPFTIRDAVIEKDGASKPAVIRGTVSGVTPMVATINLAPALGQVRGPELQTESTANLAIAPWAPQTGASAVGDVLTFGGQFGNLTRSSAVGAPFSAGEWIVFTVDVTHISGNTNLSYVFNNGASELIRAGTIVLMTGGRKSFTFAEQVTTAAGDAGRVRFLQDRNASGFGSVRVHSISVRRVLSGALPALTPIVASAGALGDALFEIGPDGAWISTQVTGTSDWVARNEAADGYLLYARAASGTGHVTVRRATPATIVATLVDAAGTTFTGTIDLATAPASWATAAWWRCAVNLSRSRGVAEVIAENHAGAGDRLTLTIPITGWQAWTVGPVGVAGDDTTGIRQLTRSIPLSAAEMGLTALVRSEPTGAVWVYSPAAGGGVRFHAAEALSNAALVTLLTALPAASAAVETLGTQRITAGFSAEAGWSELSAGRFVAANVANNSEVEFNNLIGDGRYFVSLAWESKSAINFRFYLKQFTTTLDTGSGSGSGSATRTATVSGGAGVTALRALAGSASGTFTLSVRAQGATGALAELLAGLTVGVARDIDLTQVFAGGDGTLTYTATGGTVSGTTLTVTAASVAELTVSVTATDARGLTVSTSATVTPITAMTMMRSAVTGAFVSIDLFDAYPAASYTAQGSLPAWLTLDGDLGELHGVAVAGSHTATILAADGAVLTVSIVVSAATSQVGVTGGYLTRSGAVALPDSQRATFAAQFMIPAGHATNVTFYDADTRSALRVFGASGQIDFQVRDSAGAVRGVRSLGVDLRDGLEHTLVAACDFTAATAADRFMRLWLDGTLLTLTGHNPAQSGGVNTYGSESIDADSGSGQGIGAQDDASEPIPAGGYLRWVYVNYGEARVGADFASADPASVGSPQIVAGGSALSAWTGGTLGGSLGGTWTVNGTFTQAAPATTGSSTPIAFEGALGFGRTATGGRGLPLYAVTDPGSGTGAGTLRWALTQAAATSGGRIKILAEGAYRRNVQLEIRTDNITIDARHAPGLGFWIERSGVLINADNVIIRGLRSYPGSDFMPPSTTGRDAIRIDGCDRLMIDRCDMAFALDETLSLWSFVANRTINNVTVMRSLITTSAFRGIHDDESQGVDEHAMGMIIGRATGTTGTGVSNVTIFGNVINGHEDRVPLNRHGVGVEFINNIISDFGTQSVAIEPGAQTDFVNNYWLRSPRNPFAGTDTNATSWRRLVTSGTSNSTVFVSGDEAGHRLADGSFVASLTGGWRNGTDWSGSGTAITVSSPTAFTKSGAAALAVAPQALFSDVTTRVGARLWGGGRHPVAARVLSNVAATPPFPSSGWFQPNWRFGPGVNDIDTHAPDELRAIGATVSVPAAGKLSVTLPAASAVLPLPTGRSWSEVEVYVLDAYTAAIAGGEADLPLRSGANWDTPWTDGGVTRQAIRRVGDLEGGEVLFEDIPAGFYAIRVVYHSGSVDLRLHSGRPFAVTAPALVTSDILTTMSSPDLSDRIYMAGPQHVVLDVTDASLTFGGLTTDMTAAGPTVYRLNDRDQPRKQTWGSRVNRAPWWAAFASPDGTEVGGTSPIENAVTAVVASGATGTELPGMIASNYAISINGAGAVAPTNVWRWSQMEQATRAATSGNPQVMRHRHRITLALPSPVTAGQTVAVTYGGVTLTCTAGATTPSDLIGVSQVGYEAAAPKRAVFGQWLGGRPSSYTNNGAATLLSISTDQTMPSPGTWTVRNVDTGASAASGTWAVQSGGDSITLTAGSPAEQPTGATIYVADFDGVTTPGRYRIETPDVGCSPTFEIRSGVLRDIARVIANSLDLTRADNTQNWTGSHWRQPAYDARNLRWPHLISAVRQQNTDEGPGGGSGRADKYKTLNNDATMRVLSIAGSPNATLTMETDQDWQVGTTIGTANLSGSDPTWWGRSYTVTARLNARQFVINAAAPAAGIGPLGAGDPASLTDVRADAGTSQARAQRTIIPFAGWRDAADADRRAQHGQASRALILAALVSTAMRGAQLRQPEADGYSRTFRLLGTGTTFTAPTGMSHFLRTAAWQLDHTTDMQMADGWVRGGAELSDYLNTGEGGTGLALPARIASYAYAPEAYATWEHCATAAMMAFALDRLNAGNTLSNQYRTSALAAWAVCTSPAADAQLAADGRSSAVTALRAMAPLCLWLMTPGAGGNAYRDAFFAALALETSAITMAEPVGLWLWAHSQGIVSHDPGGNTVSTWRDRARDVATGMAAAGVPYAGMTIIPSNGRYGNSLAVPNWSAERGLVAALALPLMSGGDQTTVRGIIGPWATREMLYGLGANPAGTTTISGLGARPPRSMVYRDYEALGAETVPHGIPQFGPASNDMLAFQPAVFNTHITRRGYPPLASTPWPARWNGQRNFAPMSEWTPFACHADWIGALLIGHMLYGVDA